MISLSLRKGKKKKQLLDLTREESPFVNGPSIETWKGVDSEVLSKDEKGAQNEATSQVNVHMESHLSKNSQHFAVHSPIHSPILP
jgi:hypothetical protein